MSFSWPPLYFHAIFKVFLAVMGEAGFHLGLCPSGHKMKVEQNKGASVSVHLHAENCDLTTPTFAWPHPFG